MSNSEPPKYRDLERVESKLDAMDEKLDRLLLDPTEGVFAKLTAHANQDKARLDSLESAITAASNKNKWIVSALMAIAGAIGGTAGPKITEFLSHLL